MESEWTMEEIREKVLLISKAIEQYDAITSDIVEARWRYQVLARNPHLGRTGREIVAPKDLADNIAHLETQRASVEEVLLATTGAASVDAARDVFLQVMALYQRQGALRELQALANAGTPEASGEVQKQFGDTGLQGMTDALARLKGQLVEQASRLPEVSVLGTEETSGGIFRLPE